MNNTPVLQCQNVHKTYADGHLHVDVIRDLNLSLAAQESLSIVGASGSGKSTLLHLLGGLDQPDSGSITLLGQRLDALKQSQLGKWRNKYLGFIYQFHHLLPEFSALENVMMPLLIAQQHKEQAREKALDMLDKVGLKARQDHRPSELSGGERQRTAIARALVHQPACILADEPTGNLDRKNAANVLQLMLDLKDTLNSALIVVTHDDTLLTRFDRSLQMEDGRLI